MIHTIKKKLQLLFKRLSYSLFKLLYGEIKDFKPAGKDDSSEVLKSILNNNFKKILYVGENFTGSTSLQRYTALRRVGYDLDEINFSKTFHKNSFKGMISRILNKFSYSIDFVSANDQIYKKISSEKPA